MNDKFKLAVIGSRSFTDKERLYKILDKNIDKISVIVSGGAKGADTLAHNWCEERGVPIIIFYPRWHKLDGTFDRGAGFRRNRLIIKQADKVLAMWDGVSKGTLNSIEIAKELKKPIKILTFTPKVETKTEPESELKNGQKETQTVSKQD